MGAVRKFWQDAMHGFKRGFVRSRRGSNRGRANASVADAPFVETESTVTHEAEVIPLFGSIRINPLAGAGFRSPLIEAQSDQAVMIRTETDHALFLRCCELYRVLELVSRTTPQLIETYSKYRERKQFEKTLECRYFDDDPTLTAKFDPEIYATVHFLFSHLHELRIYLRYTDALPRIVEQRILEALEVMVPDWNRLAATLAQRYDWHFKTL